MTASPLSPMGTRARERLRARPLFGRAALAIVAVVQMLMLFAPPFGGRALAEERVKGEIKVSTSEGYARLAFRFEKEVPVTVQITYPVMILSFNKPVAVKVDALQSAAPDYISAARLDPDGMSIRIALAHKVKINSTPVAEQALSRSAAGDVDRHAAGSAARRDRRTRQARARCRTPAAPAAGRRPRSQKPAAIRVKVATQPTFTRYVFAMPDVANVVPEHADGKLTLEFDQPIKWDLADAKAAMPATLKSIDADLDDDSVAVTFTFNGTPKVRTFREDRSIVVDVGHDGAQAEGGGAGRQARSKAAATRRRRAGDQAAQDRGRRASRGCAVAEGRARAAGKPRRGRCTACRASRGGQPPAAAPSRAGGSRQR